MTTRTSLSRLLTLFALLAAPVFAQQSKNFLIHAFHKDQLGGTLDCSLCHVASKEGSVTLKRPGHDQCMTCHSDDFNKDLKQAVCAQCHSSFPPSGSDDLLPYPRYKASRALLFEFSHAQHVDKKARIDPKTGFRADCTFCHKFDAKGVFASFPSHEQCATCHSKPGMKPQLTAELSAESCRGCHTPEEIENPAFTETRRFTGRRDIQGKYVDISFSHIAHFKVKNQFDLNCTTCHYAIPTSTSIQNLTLPRMIDCVQCHDSAKAIKAEFRMSNCKTCHSDTVTSLAIPTSHTRNVKPDFHTEAFRLHHEREASEPNAKCFVCHQNVTASAASKNQCVNCHQVMRPVSHTSRWKDDLHGKFAALDRTTCATCHTAAYCSDCHNELPRSHEPLPLFKAGAHAFPAKLDTRSCFTCHTFQNTCAECHVNKIAQ
ncbi:MAG TPA: cytochrome c3 family protein [Bryobacteraceae bacterium]|nr:cytochrome c3 family protein [Bryobacteraceae bacterium]